MKRMMFMTLALLTLANLGCYTWQANNGSDAVDINPLAWGSGTPVIQPSNAPGYLNGQPFDRRSR